MRRQLITLAALTITIGTLAIAGPISQRQQNQQARIHQGVRSGELTRRETVSLQRQSAHVQRTIRQDRVDGAGLTPLERVKIDHMQDNLSRRIYTQKHDRQDRNW